MTRLPVAWVLAAVSGLALAAPASGPALANAATGTSDAAAACQRAVQDTLRDTRGSAATASFTSPAVTAPGPADAAEVHVRGTGQARAANSSRPFSYTCNFDTRSGTVAGVVLRHVGGPEQAAPTRAIEPDLSQVSPAACESAAAEALKRRWPGVAGISFVTETRQLSQQASDLASLRGQGTAAPSVRDPATHFSYDCEIDPRNGRIVGVRIGD
ncbi:MAG TPA: hypothetical protein VIV84_00515 [Burkholderiaceae bacterium]